MENLDDLEIFGGNPGNPALGNLHAENLGIPGLYYSHAI